MVKDRDKKNDSHEQLTEKTMQIKTNELGYCVHIAPTCIYTSYLYNVVTCIYRSIYLLKCVRCVPSTGTFHFKFL